MENGNFIKKIFNSFSSLKNKLKEYISYKIDNNILNNNENIINNLDINKYYDAPSLNFDSDFFKYNNNLLFKGGMNFPVRYNNILNSNKKNNNINNKNSIKNNNNDKNILNLNKNNNKLTRKEYIKKK